MKQTNLCLLIVLVLLILGQTQGFVQWHSKKFNLSVKDNQEKKEHTVLGYQTIELRNITQMINYKDQIIALAIHLDGNQVITQILQQDNELQSLVFEGNQPIIGQSKILAIEDKDVLICVTSQEIQAYKINQNQQLDLIQIKNIVSIEVGDITSLQMFSNELLYVSSSNGLYTININLENIETQDVIEYIQTTQVDGELVYGVAINQELQIVAAGTKLRLWLYYAKTNTWRFDYTASVVDNVWALSWRTSDNTLWVGSEWASNVVIFDVDYDKNQPPYKVFRAGFIEGMPTTNITDIYYVQQCDTLFFGGKQGVASFGAQPSDILQYPSFTDYKKWQGIGQIGSITSPWSFFYGQRWLADGDVKSITSINNNIYVATTYGLAILTHTDNFNLRQKAIHNQKVVETHNRYGYFSDATLNTQGTFKDGLTLHPDDSDSIWTNQYLASQSYRYKVTGNIEAKEQALIAFDALKRLFKVTGIDGLVARTVISDTDEIPGDKSRWHQSTVEGYEQWVWKDDASSDDVISFYFGFPSYIEFVCENESQKQEAIQLLVDNINYIIENNYKLIDINGEPTKWGFWGPEELNDNEERYGERGTNSLEIISMLSLVYHYTNDEKYLEQINILGYDYQYFQNIINFRFQKSDEVNFSDDELGYMSYYAFFQAQESLPQEIVDILVLSLKRTYSCVQAYYPSLWTILTVQALGKDQEVVSQERLDKSILELQQWPLSWISWNMNNEDRQDSIVNKDKQRNQQEDDTGKYGVDVLKKSERAGSMKWNGNPYELKSEGNGMQEYSPTAWLLPYWIYEYEKLNFDTQECKNPKSVLIE